MRKLCFTPLNDFNYVKYTFILDMFLNSGNIIYFVFPIILLIELNDQKKYEGKMFRIYAVFKYIKGLLLSILYPLAIIVSFIIYLNYDMIVKEMKKKDSNKEFFQKCSVLGFLIGLIIFIPLVIFIAINDFSYYRIIYNKKDRYENLELIEK